MKTPQLTKRSCDLQMDVHNNKDRNWKNKNNCCCYL